MDGTKPLQEALRDHMEKQQELVQALENEKQEQLISCMNTSRTVFDVSLLTGDVLTFRALINWRAPYQISYIY